MSYILLKLINMSVTASYLLIAVMLIRLIFRKMPKYINCILWGIVALRLLLPFSLESALSILPGTEPLSERFLTGPTYDIDTGIEYIDTQMNHYLGDKYFEGVTVSVNHGAKILSVLSVIWLIGIAVLLIYGILSYLKLKKITGASLQENGIMLCDNIDTPFILGIFKPRIFMPSDMGLEERELVLKHERAHLKRRDNIWKPLGYILLTVYWFNPLMWIAYSMFCKDTEAACDQKAIKDMDGDSKKNYAQALLNCSSPKKFINACPLAFGETGVKQRIKQVLKFKKPALWITVAALILCAVTATLFLTDPQSQHISDISGNVSAKEITVYYDGIAHSVYDQELIAKTQSLLDEVKISYSPVLRTRSENRGDDYSLQIGQTYINFYANGDRVWVNDGVKPSYTYSVKEPNKVKDFLNWLMSESEYGTTLYYTCYDNEDYLYPSIVLYEDSQTFKLIYSTLSSNFPSGTYVLHDEVLILSTENEHFVFDRVDNTFVFNQAQSSPLPTYKFKENEEPRTVIPDGAVFIHSNPY